MVNYLTCSANKSRGTFPLIGKDANSDSPIKFSCTQELINAPTNYVVDREELFRNYPKLSFSLSPFLSLSYLLTCLVSSVSSAKERGMSIVLNILQVISHKGGLCWA